MSNQNPKSIFITGSSSGLGKAAAKLFSSRGWKVIASMRNPEKEAELAKLSEIALFSLDITDRQQIENAASRAVTLGGSTWSSTTPVTGWRVR